MKEDQWCIDLVVRRVRTVGGAAMRIAAVRDDPAPQHYLWPGPFPVRFGEP